MLNKKENYQEEKQKFDEIETEKQHLKFARFLKKTGFENKTLWDILQLVGLSVVVAVISIVLTQCHQRYETKRDKEKYQQTSLDNYFKEMTNILVDKKLGTLHHIRTDNQQSNEQYSISQSIALLEKLEQKNAINKEQKEMIGGMLNQIKESQLQELEAIARAQTLTTLNLLRLDRERRDLLINFLRETTLAAKDPICVEQDNRSERCRKQEQEANLLIGINLNDLKLTNIDLHFFILKKANLGKADLSKAFLSEADLSGSNLNESKLSQASMMSTNLRGAKLKNADLSNADLSNADLWHADLTGADLSNADLTGADLSNADLTGANLTHANLTNANLTNAIPELAEQNLPPKTHLCNTTMPNWSISQRNCKERWKKWPCIIKKGNLECNLCTLEQYIYGNLQERQGKR